MDREFLNQIDNLGELLADLDQEKLDDEVLICECFCVNVRDIRELFADSQEVDLLVLQNRLDLGKGCLTCLKNKDSWIDKIF
jgi:hypothetical protein